MSATNGDHPKKRPPITARCFTCSRPGTLHGSKWLHDTSGTAIMGHDFKPLRAGDQAARVAEWKSRGML